MINQDSSNYRRYIAYYAVRHFVKHYQRIVCSQLDNHQHRISDKNKQSFVDTSLASSRSEGILGLMTIDACRGWGHHQAVIIRSKGRRYCSQSSGKNKGLWGYTTFIFSNYKFTIGCLMPCLLRIGEHRSKPNSETLSMLRLNVIHSSRMSQKMDTAWLRILLNHDRTESEKIGSQVHSLPIALFKWTFYIKIRSKIDFFGRWRQNTIHKIISAFRQSIWRQLYYIINFSRYCWIVGRQHHIRQKFVMPDKNGLGPLESKTLSTLLRQQHEKSLHWRPRIVICNIKIYKRANGHGRPRSVDPTANLKHIIDI